MPVHMDMPRLAARRERRRKLQDEGGAMFDMYKGTFLGLRLDAAGE